MNPLPLGRHGGRGPIAVAIAQLPTVATAAPPKVAAVGMTVADADRSEAFCTGVLKFERVSDVEVAGPEYERLQGAFGARARFVTLRLGGELLELTQYLAPAGRPPGTGDPRWQRGGGRHFLGIDHTAIVVADSERSLRFWRDAAGLEVAGGSENHGPEQERLNNVFGARLRITALRGAAGPGVELLEYLAPRDGRPRPVGARANDLLTWQTRLAVPDAGRAADAVRASPGGWVSPGTIDSPGDELGYSRAAHAADPDGHAVVFSEEDR